MKKIIGHEEEHNLAMCELAKAVTLKWERLVKHELLPSCSWSDYLSDLPKVAVLPKLSHPNQRCWRSASATLYAAQKIHTKSPSDMCRCIGKSEFVLALTSTRHLWYNTLDKTTQHWKQHTVEFADWEDLGTKNLIPNTCKSREAALSGNFKIVFLIFVVSLD